MEKRIGGGAVWRIRGLNWSQWSE